MSKDSLAVVHEVIAAWNDHDLERWLRCWHSSCEWVPRLRGQVEGAQTYHGHEGLRRYWHEDEAVWDEFQLAPQDVHESGNSVIAICDGIARGKESGVEIREPLAFRFRFRDGLIVHAQSYLDVSEAEGISEQIAAGYRALSDGDLDAVLETLDPEIELVTSGAFPDFEPAYRGYAGFREFWNAIRAPWDWFELEPERIVEGVDCAAAAVHLRVRGAGSGAITELRQGHAHWMANGRTVRISTHSSFEEALAAVGLTT